MKDLKTFKDRREFLIREGNKAVRQAQEENWKKGLPNVYSINGKIIYQMPDGTIKTERPVVKKSK